MTVDNARGAVTSSPTYRYVYADCLGCAGYVDEPILRHTGTTTTLPTTGENALYYHRNQQYSIIGLTNATGTLVERYTYSAYGTLGIYAANGTVRTSSTYANRYTYTGREWDTELRLYHFRARWYDPATGGFVSRDPLGYVDGMSLYRGYFGVRGTDPTGRIVTSMDPTRGNGPYVYPPSFAQIKNDCAAMTGKSLQPGDRSAKTASPDVASQSVDMLDWSDRSNYCEEMLGGSNDERIRELLDTLTFYGCTVNTYCKCCDDERLGGWFAPIPPVLVGIKKGGKVIKRIGEIYVCLDHERTQQYPIGVVNSFYSTTYIHELNHALQTCRGFVAKDGGDACLASFKREMEAYFCSGQCGQNAPDPATAAVDCARQATASSCPYHCKSLSDLKIHKAISWFEDRFREREKGNGGLCDYSPIFRPDW